MNRFAGGYLAHNLMLIAFHKYWRRQPSLADYVRVLEMLMEEGLL